MQPVRVALLPRHAVVAVPLAAVALVVAVEPVVAVQATAVPAAVHVVAVQATVAVQVADPEVEAQVPAEVVHAVPVAAVHVAVDAADKRPCESRNRTI